jgi:hypothetical protein
LRVTDGRAPQASSHQLSAVVQEKGQQCYRQQCKYRNPINVFSTFLVNTTSKTV